MTERNPDAGRGEDSEPEAGSGTTGSGDTEGPAAEPHSLKKPRTGTGSAAGDGPEETPDEETAEQSPEEQEAPDGPGESTGSGDAAPPRDPERREPALPVDEDAAWAAIVAGYGKEPDDPAAETDDGRDPGSGPDSRSGGPDGETLTRPRPASGDSADGQGDGGSTPVHSFTVYSAGTGPRDWNPEGEDDGEGHFVPPEPPPLPETDPVTRFAWCAAIGGPLLLFFCILTRTDMTWWVYTLGIGGFLGGFATLVSRMRDGDDDDEDDPGRGAVV